MKEHLCLCLLFFISLTYPVYAESFLPTERPGVVPFFAWSSNELFSKDAQISTTLTEEDIEYGLYTLLHLRKDVENTKMNVLKELPNAPEVVVIFVEPQLRTETLSIDEGSFSNLGKLLTQSPSTLSAPYVLSSSSSSLLDAALIHVAEDLKQGSILVAREGASIEFSRLRQVNGVETIQADSLLLYLGENKKIFNNGVTDVIVVAFEDSNQLSAHDAFIGKVSSYVSKSTSGNYVSIYTANTASADKLSWSFADPVANQNDYPNYDFDYFLSNSSNSTNTTTMNTVFTGPIIEAFMVMIPLLTMVFVGICGIYNLQVPERYESPKVAQKNY